MEPWNTKTTEEAQPSLTVPYSYLPASNRQLRPPVVPSNYIPAADFDSSAQGRYVAAPGTSSQAFYSDARSFAPNTGRPFSQQPAPGSLAALEQQLYFQQMNAGIVQDTSMLSAPSFAVRPPQLYLGDNMDGGFGNLATSIGHPGSQAVATASNNLPFMPNFSLVDQNMLAAGPSSTYSTPPTFYDSEGGWSFDSCGQEIQSASSSSHNLPLQSQNARASSQERPQGAERVVSTPETIYDCPVDGCNKSFNRSYNYRAHMETHSANRIYPFDCPLKDCDKKFRRKTDLQRHHQSVHMKQRDHQCEFCGRYFSRKDTLRRHRDDGCSRRFETSFDLSAGPSGNENDEN